MRAGRALIGMLLLLGIFLQAQAAERRVALVIGNASYNQKPLRNPVNDAADLAAALKRLGFEVMERKNRNADELRRDLIEFQDKLGPGAVGLFYFAGHGVQAGRGQNYLLPVGVDYKRERDAEIYGLDASTVLRRMEESGTGLNLVILDACRDSPLPAEGRSTASRGLGRMEAPSGSMIAFATAPGSTADENTAGRNGLYTQHLLRAIETPGVRLEDVFKRVRRGVEAASNRRQSPEEIMKLTSDEPFYFKLGPGIQVASVVPEPVAPITPTGRPSQSSGLSLDDLEKEEATRKEWSQWQGKMKADYDKIASFKGSADLQAKAWERFLSNWSQDNPVSRDDDNLRAQARQRQETARSEASSLDAARQTQVVAQSQLQIQSTTPRANAQAGQVFKDCEDCPEMVFIPAGSFQMGSNDGYADEKPSHSVALKSFAMGKYEVTQGQWKALMGNIPSAISSLSSCGDACPVEGLTWDEIQQYIQKLNAKSGLKYRLPSEAEWEYACRAGATQTYCGSESVDSVAVYGRKSEDRTQPVGSKKANAWNLYDMSGNVWEWTQDCWNGTYTGAPSDGSAWTTGDCGQRVLRGGSWLNVTASSSRAASRYWSSLSGRIAGSGFRLARITP